MFVQSAANKLVLFIFAQKYYREEPAVAEEKHSGFSFGRNAIKPATSPLRIGTGATQVIHDASYVYIGRARSHTAEISGICFGMKDGQETLISVSEDQYVFVCVSFVAKFLLLLFIFILIE